jgi:hypothetical protein
VYFYRSRLRSSMDKISVSPMDVLVPRLFLFVNQIQNISSACVSKSSTTIETQDFLLISESIYRDVVLLIHFSGSSYPQHEILACV